jgi:Holliday junction resolvasome RuvABC ATP-dependent DNA helicase subunit
MKTRFSKLIGQTDVKKKFDFYLDSQNQSQRFPFVLLTGAKGMGKTEFAKEAARSIVSKDGQARPFLEINCGTIKNAQMFFEQVFAPVIQNNEVTVLLDECHALPKDLMTVLLSAFNTEKTERKQISWKDGLYEFNFKLQSFMLATTEQDRLFGPLKDRLLSIDFQAYSVAETAEIIKRAFSDISFEGDVLTLVAKTVRGNARSAIQRAKQIEMYCQTKHKKTFDSADWAILCDKIGINPSGLSNSEIQVLTTLKLRGDCSLSMLSAVTGMSRSALQRDVEIFLLQRGYMKIEGSRKITAEGVKALSAIEEKK